jgi:hypothetical protein
MPHPNFLLSLSPDIQPGAQAHALLRVECKREVKVRALSLTLQGIATIIINAGKNRTSRKLALLTPKQWTFLHDGVLPAGTSTYEASFFLPANLPPSHEGQRLWVRYSLQALAERPWWPDTRVVFAIPVRLAPQDREPAARLFSSHANGSPGAGPYLEVSIDRDILSPGDSLSGAIAFGNVANHRYRDLQLHFLAYEETRIYRTEVREVQRFSYQIPIEAVIEGAAIPFRAALPHGIDASFEIGKRASPESPYESPEIGALRWYVEVQAGLGWGTSIAARHPIFVVPLRRRETASTSRAVPAVGAERASLLWEQAAAPFGLRAEPGQLSGERYGAVLSLRRSHPLSADAHLVGELVYPSLQLALSVRPRGLLQRIFGAGMNVSHEEWRARFYSTARDAGQLDAVTAHLGPLLQGIAARTHQAGNREPLSFQEKTLEKVLALEEFHDERLRFVLETPGTTVAELAAAADFLLQLAEHVQSLRALLPPPAVFADSLDAWRELAQTLQAPLEKARMAILGGTLDGFKVDVVTHWEAEGRPQHTEVSLALSSPLDARYAYDWTPPQTEPPASAAEDALHQAIRPRFPQEAEEALTVLQQEAARVVVESGRVAVFLSAPLRDPAAALRVLRRLLRFVSLLRGSMGPYR